MQDDGALGQFDELATVMARLRALARARGRGETDHFGSYHNHTTWSDGTYTPEELVRRAIALGFVELGITDHGYTHKGGIHCVQDEELDAYRAMLDELKRRYENQIRILAGLEIDTSQYNPNRSSLPFEPLGRLDYVLFEYVGEPSWGGFTLDELVAARRQLPCAVGLAHPNMPILIAQHGAVTLARTLSENEIFIDACGSARNSRLVPYERPGLAREFTLNIEELGDEFKDAARGFGVQFLPSSDTHHDDKYDALVATIHAISTIIRYGFPQKTFEDESPTPK